MTLNRSLIRRYLKSGDFRGLFIEALGWDRGGVQVRVTVSPATFDLKPVAVKRGLATYVCPAGPDGAIPPAEIRRKIQRQLARQVHEHIIIFVDAAGSTQVWQWVKRELGRPLAVREHHLYSSHNGEALAQKLERLAVALTEEESITIVDVANRVRLAFDVEKPSRRFYERFQAEHGGFLKLIDGIEELADREWYASVMLNRLMFIYFIQKKGFLDGDKDYLRSRMNMVATRRGKNQFHSFYRQFLLRLFYEGLGQEEAARAKGIEELIGRVPYLNGGMFVPHSLEERYDHIQIPDSAFERVLDFFDEFQWHLDERPVGKDTEINPEVLGFIFERYINQKQMGAYYTKEDITEYIGRSTIIPRLLDKVRESLPSAFGGPASVWRLLEDDPERYVFASVRAGTDQSLPAGMQLASPEAAAEAPEGVGLPRETYRGVIDRRRHHAAVVSAIRASSVRSTDDLITWNLDSRQFAQDIVDNCDSPELLRAYYRALTSITVLDPTCGSGAFLFAAMNILQPLYEGVLDRMSTFVDEADRAGWRWDQALREEFRAILNEVNKHQNRTYFVYRTITVNNLFGVDIMEEATEICKLRLFLKLASQVDEYGEIEPLPDIDFNIRAGNTLVGFTRRPGAEAAELDLADTMGELERDAATLEVRFREYRALQTALSRGEDLIAFKSELAAKLAALGDALDKTLAGSYGIYKSDAKFRTWRNTHAPFHWWTNFYAQMSSGGFDVIVGNPPYIQAAKVRQLYQVKDFLTDSAPDIYAWVLERVADLLAPNGRTGMIVPLSLSFSSKFDGLRRLLQQEYENSWYSHFGRIPSALFNYDVRVRNTIQLGRKKADQSHPSRQYTTRLHRWFEEERPYLLEVLMYAEFDAAAWAHRIPKLHSAALISAFESASRRRRGPIDAIISARTTKHVLHFKKVAYNWLNFCRTMPPCYDSRGRLIPHTKFGEVYFADAESRDLAFLLLNGKWEFAFWYLIGDDFDVTKWMFAELPADIQGISPPVRRQLLSKVKDLEKAMEAATSFKLNAGKKVGNYNLARCRHVTDHTDRLFGEAFGWAESFGDVELLYSQAVKTSFDDAASDGEEE